MKTEFKAKFLQHLQQRRQDKGFTLIELLVVIIIIGILSAIALPSFLNQASKAKQSEAKQYISSMNKGQQAYFAERSVFATDVPSLGLGIKTGTNNYKYGVGASIAGANGGVTMGAQPIGASIKGYAGAVFFVPAGEGDGTSSILCEQLTAAQEAPAVITPARENTKCTDAQTLVTK
ncbi:MAG: type IV pilin-like G/H family protein [Microcoleus sp. PH2017_39_LGB_O_B]|uniref:type IV pilin-like G/H family protein n=1 Tax=unclassified Microcoleus TaxID=2642155 RepID=UPI001DD2586D|nr:MULTISPECIES: type IV pilin-like G/H family protein [unclassified Microcoleus]TAF84283.1 MAG: prepilin-type N-terminal cleavage/methylation domain-containing protein [Oscillatoriales cyanobacterium]MCC3451638.1 type IV pilin-like G/H family protein [Microcoleus sp. PH2017_09_SFU_O_A]MCC3493112.1 type IV pilin-like G/H family protein [Microcoleus sp. PH2017_16_JOR_D_A]MCC3632544.1 type IV pilin-like G/H family protein [Microcoleus sp. PH2017_39_LGB_O_B]MCC3644765.1 type IV pilin-like G/H fam